MAIEKPVETKAFSPGLIIMLFSTCAAISIPEEPEVSYLGIITEFDNFLICIFIIN